MVMDESELQYGELHYERRIVAYFDVLGWRSEIEQAVRTLIAAAGDDPTREGVRDTPGRVAKAYREWFAGYRIDPKAFLSRVFEEAEGYEETVLLRDVRLVSTCEHHMAAITGNQFFVSAVPTLK